MHQGRLTLADGLWFAQEHAKVEAVVDIATLVRAHYNASCPLPDQPNSLCQHRHHCMRPAEPKDQAGRIWKNLNNSEFCGRRRAP